MQYRVSLSFLDLISPLVPKQQFWGIDLSNFKIYLLNQGPLKQRDGIAHVRLSKTLKEIEVFQHFFDKKVRTYFSKHMKDEGMIKFDISHILQ